MAGKDDNEQQASENTCQDDAIARDISLAVQTGGESGAEGLAVHRHGDDEDDKVAHYLQNNVDDAIPDDVDNAS